MADDDGQEQGGRTALVTGASSGIGAATARELAGRGFTVGIVARRAERLAEVLETCREHTPKSRMWAADLSDSVVAAELAIDAWDELGGLDVLVNNAGIPMRRTVERLEMHEIVRVMRVNFFSPVAMTLALLPRMLERGQGCIVNVSSLGGRLGIPIEAAYCASKFAMSGWSETMALDLANTGVRVRLVLPGAIDTEIWGLPGNDPAMYRGPLTPAEEVATGIADAIDGESFEHYLPDLKAVVEMKTSDFDAFMVAMRAFSESQATSDSPDAVGIPEPSPPTP
jgi:short-subunit dehydrogenase